MRLIRSTSGRRDQLELWAVWVLGFDGEAWRLVPVESELSDVGQVAGGTPGTREARADVAGTGESDVGSRACPPARSA